jgi:hypothetical protein
MNGFAKGLAVALLSCVPALASGQAVFESMFAKQDAPLELDPAFPFWSGSHPVSMEKDPFGKDVPGYHTEVRSRWTKDNLYFLFICPYEQLHLKQEPNARHETNQLWNWDVAEVFIGSDFKNIKHYKEFELSPQGEWIDLDINLDKPHHEEGWVWNSGFQTVARIDRSAKVWYGAMRIPLSALEDRSPAPGNVFRINFFRGQGAAPHQKEITWQPPMSNTFHVPDRFGILKLVDARALKP